MAAPPFPQQIVDLPDCQENWEHLSKPNPAALLYSNTTQSINNATITKVTYTTIQYQQGLISPATGGDITILVPGIYYCWGECYFINGNAMSCLGIIAHNGLTDQDPLGARVTSQATAVQDATTNPSCFLKLARGDTVQQIAYQTSGVALNIGLVATNVAQNKLGCVWLSP